MQVTYSMLNHNNKMKIHVIFICIRQRWKIHFRVDWTKNLLYFLLPFNTLDRNELLGSIQARAPKVWIYTVLMHPNQSNLSKRFYRSVVVVFWCLISNNLHWDFLSSDWSGLGVESVLLAALGSASALPKLVWAAAAAAASNISGCWFCICPTNWRPLYQQR